VKVLRICERKGEIDDDDCGVELNLRLNLRLWELVAVVRGGRRNWLWRRKWWIVVVMVVKWWFESGGKSLLEERESGKEKMRENKLLIFL
jgi:hypothetical protein